MNWVIKIVWAVMLVLQFINMNFESLDMANLAYMIMCVGIGIIMCLPKEKDD